MKKLLFLSSLALTLCSAASAQTTTGQAVYGTTFSTQEAVMSPGRLGWLMQDKQTLTDFKMTGYISEVCQKEGCWMYLRTAATADDDVLIKVKDHAFALPKTAAGKKAAVSGTVVKKMQSVEEQKHLLQDAGASAEQIAKVTAPKEIYEMQATGIVIFN